MQLMEQRRQLACALRWAARLDLHEGVDNHFSLAVPDQDGAMRGNRFLINPQGFHWSEIDASSLVLCDQEGTVLEGDNRVELTAFFIHGRVHIAGPGAVASANASFAFILQPRSIRHSNPLRPGTA